MNKMKKWSRGIYIVSIVAQAAFFIFAAAMAVFAVLSVVQKNSFGSFIISLNGGDAVVGTNGFQISIADGSGNVIRLVREIGYFCIAIPAVEFIFGFAVLCLSQFFSYGMKLEQEIEGLV